MRKVDSQKEEAKSAFRILTGIYLGRPRRKWKKNIGMVFKERKCQYVELD
jgi:hypothetical protein